VRKLVIGFLAFMLSSYTVAYADDPPVPVPELKNWTGGDLQSLLPMLGYPPTQATIDKLTTYIDAHPDDPEGYMLRCSVKSTVYRNSGSGTIKEALDDCNHALSLAPNTSRPHLVAAVLLRAFTGSAAMLTGS